MRKKYEFSQGMKLPLHERARKLAGLSEAQSFVTSNDPHSGSFNLEKLMDRLVKQKKLEWSDAQYVLDQVFYNEPSGPKSIENILNLGGDLDPQVPKDIYKAYKKDVKAGEKRPRY